MSMFTCARCYRNVDSDYFPCHLVKIDHRKLQVNQELICEDCLMELVEDIEERDGEDFEMWEDSEYTSVLKLINENKIR